ncbi:MAG TPA: hypothetical protein VK866_11720 [Acidimicrobiales bacterium]|nr:hypothetical protein [Acidimicrobiales bacterium]
MAFDSRAVQRARLVARVAMVAAALGAVAGLILVDRTGDTYDEALTITVQAARVGAEAADPVSGLAAQVSTLGQVGVVGLDDAAGLLDTAAGSADELAVVLGEDLPLAIEGTQRIADRVAGVFETIERFIPGNSESAAEDLRDISDGLESVPGDLRGLGADLSQVSAELASAARTLDAAGIALEAASAEVDEVVLAIAELPDLFDQLERSAVAARDDLGSDRWWWRLVVVAAAVSVGGLALAVDRALAALVTDDEVV